ncbi:MAG: hypothetical protein JXN64_12630 [Spirochaetes bacterium]|nr:hypothetical protein [Spirochaetota bacterium]
MKTRKKIADLLLRIPFVYKAVNEKADLSAFKIKPANHILIRNAIGLFLIIFSYVIGWPFVIALGVIAIKEKEPLFIVIGGPIAYGVSHLVFWAGMYLTGAHYTFIFLRWAVRVAVEKLAGTQENKMPVD